MNALIVVVGLLAAAPDADPEYRGEKLSDLKVQAEFGQTPMARRHAVEFLGCLARQRRGWNTDARKSDQADWVAKEIVPTLVKVFDDPDPALRADAANAFRNLGSTGKSALPDLIKLLADPNPGVRQRAAMALGTIGPEAESALPALNKMVHEDAASAAAEAMILIGPDRPELIALFDDQRVGVRRAVAVAMFSSSQRVALPQMVRLLQDEDEQIRRFAASVVFPIQSLANDVLPRVPALLADKSPHVRSAVLDGLRYPHLRAETPRFLAELAKLSGDESKQVRCQLAISLGYAGVGAVATLTKLLDDKETKVRALAADALGQIGPDVRQAAPALKRLLNDMAEVYDKQGRVCNHAGQALFRILGDRSVLEGLPKMPADGK